MRDFVVEDLSERAFDDSEWIHETDKAWDAMHRCLTHGMWWFGARRRALRRAVMGGRRIYSGDDWIMCLVEPVEVAATAKALGTVTKAWLRKRYFALKPEEYEFPLSEEDCEYTWEYFEGLPGFFERAAGAGRAVLFTADQ